MAKYIKSNIERNGETIRMFNEKIGELTTLTLKDKSPDIYRMIGFFEGQKEAYMSLNSVIMQSKVVGPKLECTTEDECASIMNSLDDIMERNGVITLGDVKNQAGELAFDSDQTIGWIKDTEKPYTKNISSRTENPDQKEKYVIVFIPYKNL